MSPQQSLFCWGLFLYNSSLFRFWLVQKAHWKVEIGWIRYRISVRFPWTLNASVLWNTSFRKPCSALRQLILYNTVWRWLLFQDQDQRKQKYHSWRATQWISLLTLSLKVCVATCFWYHSHIVIIRYYAFLSGRLIIFCVYPTKRYTQKMIGCFVK